MITVHHLNNARSQRVLWLLEELGLPYDIVRYQRDPKTLLAPPSLRAIHPLGKAPVVTDGSRTLAESGAIIEYLVGQYGNGRLVPEPGSDARLRYTYWMHYAEGSFMPLMVMKLVFSRLGQPPVPFFVRPAARAIAQGLQRSFLGPQVERNLEFIEESLLQHAWFAGDAFSAADIQMSFALEAALARGGLDGARHPRTCAVLERMRARPAYQRALEKGGPLHLGD